MQRAAARNHRLNFDDPVGGLVIVCSSMSAAQIAARSPKCDEFDGVERAAVILHFLLGSTEGGIQRGAYSEAVDKFGCYC